MSISKATTLISSLGLDQNKKPKIHIFFVTEGNKPGSFKVLGDSNSSTNEDLSNVEGLFEIVTFQQGEYPEAMMVDIESLDKSNQGYLRQKLSIHIFCRVQYRSSVVDCLSLVKDEYIRELVLHVGDEEVGWVVFKSEGYGCGGYRR